MGKRVGKQTVAIENNVHIIETASIAGTKEQEGPLGETFDILMPNAEWNEETWEKTESKMQKEAVKLAIRK